MQSRGVTGWRHKLGWLGRLEWYMWRKRDLWYRDTGRTACRTERRYCSQWRVDVLLWLRWRERNTWIAEQHCLEDLAYLSLSFLSGVRGWQQERQEDEMDHNWSAYCYELTLTMSYKSKWKNKAWDVIRTSTQSRGRLYIISLIVLAVHAFHHPWIISQHLLKY